LAPSPSTVPEPEPAPTPLQIQPVQGTPGEPYDPRQIYDAVVVELNKLLVNPDPDKLELTVSRDCDCYTVYRDYFDGLVQRGEVWERPAVPELLFFEVVSRSDDGFSADIVDAPVPNRLLRPTDPNFVEEPPLDPPLAKRVTLKLEEGHWRLSELQMLVDVEGNNLGVGRISGSDS